MEDDWKANLADYFEETRIIQSSQLEALKGFDHFCEFVAEPAFESLAEELEQYGVRSRIRRIKGRSISFQINFPGSRIDNFFYTIFFPRNSLELKLVLHIKGRAGTRCAPEAFEESFLPERDNPDLLKLSKSELIQDLIEHLRNYNFQALTRTD